MFFKIISNEIFEINPINEMLLINYIFFLIISESK